jgi:PAS domain S-box-containing protein
MSSSDEPASGRTSADTPPGESPPAVPLSRALDFVSQGVLIAGRDRLMVYANPAFTDITGYAAAEILGRSCGILQGPGTDAATVREIRASLLEERPFAGEILNYRKDGSTFWNELSITPVRNEAGVTTHFIGVTRDVTARRRADAQRESVLGLLSKIASQVPGVVYQYRLRPDGTACFPYASDAIRSIYRVAPEEVREDASVVHAVLHPDDVAQILRSILESADRLTPWNEEYRVRFPDGVVRWLHGNAVPQRDADGSVLWHGFITDITARKEEEERLRNMERKLQETQKLESLGVLAGGIAHDFNNILSGIVGNCGVALAEVPAGSSAAADLEAIRHGALRAADLCRQLLAYSGRGRFLVQRLSMNSLVGQTIDLLRLAISKKAELRLRLENDLPAASGDATQLRQVLMNLVINASEALGEGGGSIEIVTGRCSVPDEPDREIVMAEASPEGFVFVEVADSGCGMDEATLGRVFDPFFTTKFSGRGLGLAAVLGIVRGHRGGLRLWSEPGRGTRFRLFLPADPGPVARVEPHVKDVPWRGSGTVLLVDDEPAVRRAGSRMLRKLGFEVMEAEDGEEAVRLYSAASLPFAVVLMDLTMPRLDGRRAFERLQGIDPTVRVVMMSGFNEDEAVSTFKGAPPLAFLHKPFSVEELQDVLRRASAPR